MELQFTSIKGKTPTLRNGGLSVPFEDPGLMQFYREQLVSRRSKLEGTAILWTLGGRVVNQQPDAVIIQAIKLALAHIHLYTGALWRAS